MRTTMSAVEWRIHEELKLHAAAEGWPVPPRLLGRIARLAAHAAGEPRPVDSPPRGKGRKPRGRAPAQS